MVVGVVDGAYHGVTARRRRRGGAASVGEVHGQAGRGGGRGDGLGRAVVGLTQAAQRHGGRGLVHRHADRAAHEVVVGRVRRCERNRLRGGARRGGRARRSEAKAPGNRACAAAQRGRRQGLAVSDRRGHRPGRYRGGGLVHRHADRAADGVVIGRVRRRERDPFCRRARRGGRARRGEGKAPGHGSRAATQRGRRQCLAVSDCRGRRPSRYRGGGLVHRHADRAADGVVVGRVRRQKRDPLRGRARRRGGAGRGKSKAPSHRSRAATQRGRRQRLAVSDRRGHRPGGHDGRGLVHRLAQGAGRAGNVTRVAGVFRSDGVAAHPQGAGGVSGRAAAQACGAEGRAAVLEGHRAARRAGRNMGGEGHARPVGRGIGRGANRRGAGQREEQRD